MDVNQRLILNLILASTLTLTMTTVTHARNCTKGKPCGKGCIAQDKTCRMDTGTGSYGHVLRYEPGLQPGVIIHKPLQRLPSLHRIKTVSVAASDSPYSTRHTGQLYKMGQRVFVYETYNNWARINNMQPEEWIELRFLEKLGKRSLVK